MLSRMKRPPGLWLLLSAGVLCLCFKDVSCVRATSLIFAKTTTTTSSTAAPGDAAASVGGELEDRDALNATTKSPRTGNPQLDYIHDPNLPRELNGYVLSEYPFYDRLPPPEEIDFKCDGLHDGFYASVAHKCQVYHHCISGTRYDFLCANYTAFDQKTFICQFVSEVDCVNSKKFWHRNDALYETPTTTTRKPVIIYQQAPPPHAALNPTGSGGGGNRKPSTSLSRRRRPYRRRRPQYDYYDDEEEAAAAADYYDDEPRLQVTPEPERSDRRRNKRPRPRPRPVYDDEYEYEDDRYDRRTDKRRGMYDDRRRYKDDRRKYDDEYEDDAVEDPKFDREDRDRKKEPERKRRPESSSDGPQERRNSGNRRKKPARNNDDYYEEDLQERPLRKGSSVSKDPIEDRPVRKSNSRDSEDTQKSSSSGEKRTRRPIKQPKDDDYQDQEEEPVNVEQRNQRPRQSNKETSNPSKKPSRDRLNEPAVVKVDEEEISASRKINDNPPEGVPLVKPSSGSSIYNRPRAAPKIRPPVPKNEQDKYSYKTSTIRPGSGKPEDEEYYDDYEEELPLPKRPASNKPPKIDDSTNSRPSKPSGQRDETKMSASRQRNQSRRPNYEQDEIYERERERPLRDKNIPEQERPLRDKKIPEQDRKRKRPVLEEYDEDYEELEKSVKVEVVSKPSRNVNKFPERNNGDKFKKTSQIPSTTSTATSTTSTTITSTTTKPPEVTSTKLPDKKEKQESAIRIIKRPFLPSRGGSPFSARGLLPVGTKALLEPPLEDFPSKSPPPKQPPFRAQQQQQQLSYTQSNKIPLSERNPLDIKEDEYDVTLNDALNPTLPNLPVRNGFSSPANDFSYNQFRRAPQREQQQYVEPQVSHSQKTQIRFQDVQTQQRYEPVDNTASQNLRFQTAATGNPRHQPELNSQRFSPVPQVAPLEAAPLNQRLGPQLQPQQYEPQTSFAAVGKNSNSDYRGQFSHTVPVTYQFRTGPRVTHMHAHAQPFYTTF